MQCKYMCDEKLRMSHKKPHLTEQRVSKFEIVDEYVMKYERNMELGLR